MNRVVVLAIVFTAAVAASFQAPAEHGSLRLFYIQKPIGTERYDVTRSQDRVKLSADFAFTDRGGAVQLAATVETAPDYSPISFRARGKSYRFVNVDSEVRVEGASAVVRADGAESARRVEIAPPFFTIDGYAPFAAQMLLVRYWLQHGRPHVVRTVPGLPVNDVFIEARGQDPIRLAGKVETLDRFSIDGVVWGRGALWLDHPGAFAAAVTRAGGLSFEAVREDLEPALLDFVRSSTRDRVADLESITRRIAPVRSGTYALTGATIVDGTGGPPIENGVVVIRDGRIADVGPAGTAVPAGLARVDVAGKTIVPGLWDMHTHVTQIEWAPVYLAAGVTTVRDMGNELEFITAFRDAIVSHRALGPRLLLAGLVDGGGPNAFGVVTADSVDEGRAVVRKYHDAGFQQMKIYSLVTPPVVSAISGEAHRLGMTVTGHLPNGMTIEQAVTAGMDQIAHLSVRGEPGSDDLKQRIAFLRDHGTVIDPTQSWNELLGHAQGAPIEAFQPAIHKIPPPLDRLFSNAGVAGIDAAAARARLDRGLQIVRALHDGGVRIVAGTDEGIPGHSLHRELELYVEAGFTPLAALQSATIEAARAMRLDGELGTIERGKRADLAVLDANPLDAIRNIRTVRWTIADGRMYESAALWKSVRFQP